MRTWRVLCATILLMPAGHGRAQYWASVGSPDRIHPQVNVIYGDTVWDRLLMGGNFKWIITNGDSLRVDGTAMWDGAVWERLPDTTHLCTDTLGNMCAPIYEFIRYKGDLYLNGGFGFYTTDSVINARFARWDTIAEAWTALECPNAMMGGLSTMVPVPPQETVYLTGYLSTVCGHDSSCVFTYDGDTITPFELDDPMLRYDGNYVGYVFKYLGTTYVTGSLWDPILEQPHSFMRWNGNELEDVPGWPPLAPIKDLLIHDGQLYVCGWFFEATGGPGNMVARFDGQQWHTLGGGLTMTLAPSTGGVAMDLHEWNDDIYVAGQFNYAGGAPAINVARWNGNQWCGLGGLPYLQADTGNAWSLTNWRDELYMAGAFVTIDGDTMWNVARWLGQVENCSEPVAVVETPSAQPLLVAAGPEPGTWTLLLASDAVGRLEIIDINGRVVSRIDRAMNNTMIDLRGQATGMYVARYIDQGAQVSSVRLIRP